MKNSKSTNKHWLVEPLNPLGIGLKLSVLFVIAMANKSTPTQASWAITMVVFAALIIIPIAIEQVSKHPSVFFLSSDILLWHLPCAMFLALSFLMNRSPLAGIFSLPYASWCMEVFLRGIKYEKKLPYLTYLITFAFLANASIWLLFDRFGIQPLGFSAWIVILTGAHFHFAGFALMVSLSLFLSLNPHNQLVRMTIIAIVMGIVLTASGIITTQLGLGHELETIAGVWMSISATSAGYIFIKHSFAQSSPTKYLWLIGGVCLILAMVLAFLYAMRTILALEFLSMSFMQAIHGTLNALGFGTLVLLGWALKK